MTYVFVLFIIAATNLTGTKDLRVHVIYMAATNPAGTKCLGFHENHMAMAKLT